MVHQIEPSLKDCNKKRAAISCNAYFGAPSVGALRKCSCGAFLATSPRETNTSACAKCESVPKGMVQQKSRNIRCGFSWCTISGRVKNSVLSACRPLRPPFCFAKPLVRLYAARGVHCSLPAFAHAQSWPLLTNPQPFLATSPRETNTSACAKCESVPKGMVQQKSRNIRCGFFWCTIGDSNPGPTD